MERKQMYTRFIFVIALLILTVRPAAAANVANVSCGDTISAPGYYTLAASCTCTGNGACITINADDVTLNLNNKTITCSPSNPLPSTNATTFGVMASSLKNTTILGSDPSVAISTGKITGCFFGLHASYDQNLFVDRVNFSGNTYIGANTGYSTDVLLTRNTIDGISGYVGDDGHNGYAIAFNGCGTRCTLSSNIIKNVVVQPKAIAPVSGEGVGIILSSNSTSAVMSNNWLENANESGLNIGIWVADGSSATIEANSITGFWEAVSGSGSVQAKNNRLLMRNASAHANSIGIYSANGCASNNLIVRYATPIASTIANCGGNIVYP
jgi:hypothetical protein